MKQRSTSKTRWTRWTARLPWRDDPPYLPSNKVMAEQRLDLLRKWLSKHKTCMKNIVLQFKTT